MHLIMYCITILSVLCIVSIEMSGLLYIGLMIFYVSAGFFAIYLMTSFMSFSIKTEKPDVWAGLGRAINNLSAVITTLPALTLLGSKMNVTIIVTALILFVLISIFMVLYFLQYRHVDEKEEEIPQNVLEDEELFEAFSDAYSLTPKEKEVLRLLLTTEDNIQDIAEQLFISRAALYRHIGSLNEKTETKSRIGILQCYYKWNGKF